MIMALRADRHASRFSSMRCGLHYPAYRLRQLGFNWRKSSSFRNIAGSLSFLSAVLTSVIDSQVFCSLWLMWFSIISIKFWEKIEVKVRCLTHVLLILLPRR